MPALPLFAHQRPESILAYRGGQPISAGRFLRDARSLAARLPAGAHVLNLCSDRYRFTVGLAASLLARQVQPAASDAYAGGDPAAARIRAGCVLPDR